MPLRQGVNNVPRCPRLSSSNRSKPRTLANMPGHLMSATHGLFCPLGRRLAASFSASSRAYRWSAAKPNLSKRNGEDDGGRQPITVLLKDGVCTGKRLNDAGWLAAAAVYALVCACVRARVCMCMCVCVCACN